MSLINSTPHRNSGLMGAGFLAAVALAWHGAAAVSASAVLPTPLEVIASVFDGFVERSWAKDLIASVARTLAGVSLAFVLATLLGTAIGVHKTWEALLRPFLLSIRYVPAPALVPLSILFLGIGELQKVGFLAVGVFVHLVPIVVAGVQATERQYLDLAKSSSMTDYQIIRHIILPANSPLILDTLRTGFAIGWSYLILVELIAASNGLGQVMVQSQRFVRPASLFGAILLIALIGLATDLLFGRAHRKLFPWSTQAHNG
jgi:NitT/TauT family transport system permease protein